MKVIGLMSGTSADGVDAALVEIESKAGRPALRLLAWDTLAFPAGLRERILAVASGGTSEEVCRLDAYLGELFAEAAAWVARRAGVELGDVDLIGSHGQTIHHLPAPRQEGAHAVRSSLQIGEPAVIAERTGLTTIADFRPRDLAAGGEGAPLTPIVHQTLFAHPDRGRVILNLGGIANVTVLPAGADASSVTGFDTGPGNVLLDECVRATGLSPLGYDEDGRLAAAGQVQPDLLQDLLKDPSVRRAPPKSTGRERFGPAFVERFRAQLRAAGVGDLDGLATLAAFTVDAVVQNLRDFVFPKTEVHEVVVTGGGARNAFLMRRLAESLPECLITSSDALGVPGRALEAVAFAWLAYLTATGRPGNLPGVTGARGARVLGCIVPGKGFRGILAP
ncbi:MAG: anhydro-N-acetylmuramic acid kinase [candidate division NC10 bacterium]|nr:anhydro-N-acetylmuramic acid kinase [candidate division NC10 bacterium]